MTWIQTEFYKRREKRCDSRTYTHERQGYEPPHLSTSIWNQAGSIIQNSSRAVSTTDASSSLQASHGLWASMFSVLATSFLVCIPWLSVIAYRGSELRLQMRPLTSRRSSKVIASKATRQALRFSEHSAVRFEHHSEASLLSRAVTMNVEKNLAAASLPLKVMTMSSVEISWCVKSGEVYPATIWLGIYRERSYKAEGRSWGA